MDTQYALVNNLLQRKQTKNISEGCMLIHDLS